METTFGCQKWERGRKLSDGGFPAVLKVILVWHVYIHIPESNGQRRAKGKRAQHDKEAEVPFTPDKLPSA